MLALLLIPLSIIPVPSKRGAKRGNDTCTAVLKTFQALQAQLKAKITTDSQPV